MVVFSVSQLLTYLKDLLNQDAFLQDLWIQGEVSNLAQPGSGHSYFSLRDSNVTVRCVMFRGSLGSELLSDGALVISHGRASVYEARGDLQLIVDIVQPQGVGDLKLQFEELKLKLDQEGLFELSRKRQIPSFPNKIGVVTSPTGAVWHDIQNVVNRRYPLVELILAPTLVQGDDAPDSIADAIGCLNQIADLDVILLARGGGSLEDLWSFNEESVARAIFASQVPIITGIGHETDSTISDLVADQFASTPSVAAEMVVPSSVDLISKITDSQHILTTSAKNLYGTKLNHLMFLDTNLRGFKFGFDNLRQQTDDLLSGALKSIRRDFAQLSERTRSIMMRLESLSPEDTLRRGYAIVQTHNDTVVKDFSQINSGEMVDVTLSRGGFEAKVQSVSSDDQK